MRPRDRLRFDVLDIVHAGVAAVDPGHLVANRLADFSARSSDIFLVAAGKAAGPMAQAATRCLGMRVRGGVVVGPVAQSLPEPLIFIRGEHPLPGPRSVAAGRSVLDRAREIPNSGLFLVLISGGASSLLSVPASGISIEDKRRTSDVLMRAGADIYALNTVRKHLSLIKGGRLAAACRGVSYTLVLSDVVGDDLSVIASGPTVPDASTYPDALDVLDEYGGRGAYPAAVVAHLTAGVLGREPESPKPGDPRLARASTELVGGRFDAMAGAALAAERLGYTVVTLTEPTLGEARSAGERLAGLLENRIKSGGPLCLIASGETTVRVMGSGLGGRNQELALSVSAALAETVEPFVFASVGTDGIDGPTDAAGGIVDHTTAARARQANLSPVPTYLEQNNSYAFFDALGDLIRTGPTGTNVGDLQVCLIP